MCYIIFINKFYNLFSIKYIYFLQRTVFDTVCETTQEVNEVLDDVVRCETVQKQVCKFANDGLRTQQQDCEELPHERCSVSQQPTERQSPRVTCNKIRKEICSDGCAIKEVLSIY